MASPSFPLVSGDLRLLSTNICWYPLCDLHSFLTVTLWRLATVHSNGRIVLILFLSSPWDITWQQHLKIRSLRLFNSWQLNLDLMLLDLTDKMKHSFFQAAVVSILLYGCTTWTLTERLKKKLDGNYTRMLRAILNKSWRQHPTRHQLYGHLPPITKTIQVRRTRHTGHCWRSKDKLISDVLLWTPAYGQAKAGRPARTYIQQLCEDTGCNPEDLPKAMNDWEKWRERVRDIRAGGTTWWWWWWFFHPGKSYIDCWSFQESKIS